MTLKRIPAEQDLMRLYWELSQIGAPAAGKKQKWPYIFDTKEGLLVLAFEMLRYDPRLLSILIIYFREYWKDLNPARLRYYMAKMSTPQAVGVLAEFILEYDKDLELKYFFDYLLKGLKPVSAQLFFIGTFGIGSTKHLEMAQKTLKQYSRWGFLGRERPIVNLTSKETVGSYDSSTRKKIILNILKTQKTISVNEYLSAIEYSISRQQALYDLKHIKSLKLKGMGRGAKWTLTKNAPDNT